jgi:hypothetical protein
MNSKLVLGFTYFQPSNDRNWRLYYRQSGGRIGKINEDACLCASGN